MHRWISTDNGSQCFRCGVVVDYGETDETTETTVPSAETDRQEMLAMSLVPPCHEPTDDRAHHFVLEFDRLACAYGDAIVRLDTEHVHVPTACTGA